MQALERLPVASLGAVFSRGEFLPLEEKRNGGIMRNADVTRDCIYGLPRRFTARNDAVV
jgi:hypothetical protein